MYHLPRGASQRGLKAWIIYNAENSVHAKTALKLHCPIAVVRFTKQQLDADPRY
ncbi:hypothetical protein K432DRAFT_384280 [Lepidopterella palustris CBS 459.81]|uniref:Uncharacterized protein n=1 Tax=Lepidopterella palustris CBS 459.81 TaxID=1314670 RepID=A0A8E2E661_9PEZI|nr:hypothetical protein K432DRAFT_384280 [Lepidopterella palustris CBS 459.81]